MTGDADLLEHIDHYLDAVPRAVVRVESIGPFTLFVNEGHGWRYYARPTPGADDFTAGDVEAVRARQRELNQPEAIEWVVERAPGVGLAAESNGMTTLEYPLMHQPADAFVPVTLTEVDVDMLEPGGEIEVANAVAHLAFSAPGTTVGPRDDAAFRTAVAEADPETIAFTRARLHDGFTRMAVARIDGQIVASGSYQPNDGTAELTGIATLPAFRRRGIAAALTSALVQDAFADGIATVFLSADDEAVAGVYARIGFRIVGRAGVAAVPGESPS